MSAISDPNPTTSHAADRTVLHGIPWAAYRMMRDADENRHVRMDYDDGRLEIMPPQYRHERFAGLLGKIVMTFAGVVDLPCLESRTTTFQVKRRGKAKGKAKEPDTSFYLGANELKIRGKSRIDLPQDPPPDLAIEVDETTDSRRKLAIYAGLGVPEVWRFDVEELWFGRLGADGAYARIERSLALPMLTPEIVASWLARAETMAESRWLEQLPVWIRGDLGL